MAIKLVQYYVDLGYDRVIEFKKLEADEYTKFTKTNFICLVIEFCLDLIY